MWQGLCNDTVSVGGEGVGSGEGLCGAVKIHKFSGKGHSLCPFPENL